ncbi:hypothetical protein [Streptomyces sp. BRA346]|uniref:hypothetical protein n=1 Tax=Streptomyces sp. BRA346 TaxID=2878199 RepID=UPI0040641CE5
MWTADPDRGEALARKVSSGTIEVNAYANGRTAPFGGVKNSSRTTTHQSPGMTGSVASSTNTGRSHRVTQFPTLTPPVGCLATALQSRIRHSRPGSDLSAGGRQGALPRLDAGRSQRPGRPRATCLRKPTQRHHRQSPPSLSHGERDSVLPP